MDNQIKHRLIDKIMSTNNEKILSAIDQLLDSIETPQEKTSLTKEQKWMLEMSEEDLKNGKTISQQELDKNNLTWLKDQ